LLERQNCLQYCSSCLSFLHNYFDGPTELFSDLYLVKFLDILVKLFFLVHITRIKIVLFLCYTLFLLNILSDILKQVSRDKHIKGIIVLYLHASSALPCFFEIPLREARLKTIDPRVVLSTNCLRVGY